MDSVVQQILLSQRADYHIQMISKKKKKQQKLLANNCNCISEICRQWISSAVILYCSSLIFEKFMPFLIGMQCQTFSPETISMMELHFVFSFFFYCVGAHLEPRNVMVLFVLTKYLLYIMRTIWMLRMNYYEMVPKSLYGKLLCKRSINR